MLSRPSPPITLRELAGLALAAVLVAVVMTWPLAANLGDVVPKDLGDPLAQAWQAAWGGYALGHQPLDFFDANQFWPLQDTLAFSDALVGYAPAGLVGSGPEAAIARYGLLFIFAYALAFAGAYLLARELGLGRGPAVVAGAAFAFAPFRLEQDGHLHIISSGGIPLALALGVRGYRDRSPAWVVAAFAVAAWQVSIGFSLGLPFVYLLGLIGLVAAIVWWRRGRPAPPRAMAVATVAGIVLLAVSAYALSRPYERVAAEHPQASRTPETIEAFSGPPYVLLVAPDENMVWADATGPLRDTLINVPEKTLFPGLVIVLLAIAGLARGPAPPRPARIGLAAFTLGVWILAVGFQTEGGWLWPYRIVYELLPGWDGIRTPGRLVTFSSLSLAILAAGGAAAVAAWIGRRREISEDEAADGSRTRSAGRIAGATVAVLAVLIAIEGRGLPFDPGGWWAMPEVPAAPASVADVAAPQLHLPAGTPEDNRRYLLWSTDGFPAIVNGRSSIDPVFTAEAIAAAEGFPDATSVASLRELGIESVVIHLDRTAGTSFAGVELSPHEQLGLARERRGDLLIYELTAEADADGSGSAAVPGRSPAVTGALG